MSITYGTCHSCEAVCVRLEDGNCGECWCAGRTPVSLTVTERVAALLQHRASQYR